MTGDDLAAVVDIAAEHRVTGSVTMALREAGRELPDDLAELGAASTVAHLQTLRALAEVADVFGDAGVRWAVVKGPAVAERWRASSSVRTYDDLDLLVDPISLSTAVDALVSMGYQHRNHNWEGFRKLGVGEVPLDDGRVVIDLHWHLIGLAEPRRQLRLPTSQLLDRSVLIQVGGRSYPTLDDADTLVHLCTHAALAGAQSLVQLMDVNLVARSVCVPTALERAEQAGAGRLAVVVLDRSEQVFGRSHTPSLADSICDDHTWRWLNQTVDRTWARLRPGSWTPFPGSLARAGRTTRPATARAVWAALLASARAKVGARTVMTPGGPLDWEWRDGDDSTRARFFREVESGRYGE